MKIYTNQKLQFENQEAFRRLSRPSEIRCVGFAECSTADRGCKIREKAERDGTIDVAFVCNGTHLRLHFFHWMYSCTDGLRPTKEFCDFEKEPGRLHFKSPVIYNGVCVLCVGWINLTKLDGSAKLEFNQEFAKYEHDHATITAPDDITPRGDRNGSQSISLQKSNQTSRSVSMRSVSDSDATIIHGDLHPNIKYEQNLSSPGST